MAEYPNVSWDQDRLQDALKSHDGMMRMGAIRVLQEAPKDEYVKTLIDALGDTDRLVRINSCIALGKAKTPLAVVPLVYRIVADEDKEVQTYAAWALKQVDYLKVSPRLVSILLESNNDAMVRYAASEIRQKVDGKAIDSLVQLFSSRQFYTWYDIDIKAVNGLYEIGYITVEPLIKCLDSDDLRVKANAIYALGKIGDVRAVQPLVSRMHGSNIEIRARIADALIKIGRGSVSSLIKMLDDNDREIKWIAAYCLAGIGKEAEPALLKKLGEKGQQSEEVIFALSVCGGKDAFQPLGDLYYSTRDDGVRAWLTVSLANIVARNYTDIRDRQSVNKFMDGLGDQLKPHMLIKYDALNALGKIYVRRALTASGSDVFKSNLGMAVKCFDLSLIEQENMAAKAYRLFYGSYLKLMNTKSAEIYGYIEKDINDLKREAEKTENKKEIIYLLGQILSMLHTAYEDKSFSFMDKFKEYSLLCGTMEDFLATSSQPEEARKLTPKELTTLHTDVEIIQRKITGLLAQYGASGDETSAAQLYRLSTEIAKLDTGMYDDYRVIESCLRNIVSRASLSNDEKSELYFKILLVSKNGLSQLEMVLDQVAKGAGATVPAVKAEEKPKTTADKAVKEKQKSASAKKSNLKEYIAIVILAILILAVLLLALNKFGIFALPITFPSPLDFLNPASP